MKLAIAIGISTMFLITAISSAGLNELNTKAVIETTDPYTEEEMLESTTLDDTTVSEPIPFDPFGPLGPLGQDNDWNYWTNPPHMFSNVTGNIGIGVTSPLAKFHVKNGAVLFSGGTGGVPTSGAGTRFMWIPSKSALRAGYVDGTQWNNINVGKYSVAMGYNTKASELASTAMGYGTLASGWGSTAMGCTTKAGGYYSIAGGYYSNASAMCSTAFGYNTLANGSISTALGYATRASGPYSTAIGNFIKVNGYDSVGIGISDIPYTVNAANVLSIMGGKVGIGTTSPSAPLDVNGDVETSGNYKYSSAKTYYLEIPAAAFTVTMPDDTNSVESYTVNGYWYVYDGNNLHLMCPVNLPYGATVTEFRVYAYDNTAANHQDIDATLYRRYVMSTSLSTMAKIVWTPSDGGDTIQTNYDNTISYATIDNQYYQYFIHIINDISSDGNTLLRFYGGRIQYTMDTITP
jgi:hypothetical protein